MKTFNAGLVTLGLFLAATVACTVPAGDSQSLAVTSQPITAAGSIPAGLPQRVLIGLKEGHSTTWMKDSGVSWDARYRYFTKGWVNNWGYGSYNGNWGLDYMQQCDTQGFIPVVQYYQMHGEPGGGETAFLAKVKNATTMAGYFGDFKILMQRAKDFGKPVVVLLEADGFAFLQQQANSNPSEYAAVAATNLPELAGLPNTVAGWGLAFLQMRKEVAANNVILGIHVSAWAGNYAISYLDTTVPLQPEVDKVYDFLAPLGLASNVTGQTYDLLVGDPLDRDSDYYKVTDAGMRWWDACDNASLSSASFNRYAEWLRLWNIKANRRWVLWQIPLGNSHHLNVPNNGGPREGYKDNRPEYFFGNETYRTAHVARFAQSGVIALLFGAGADGQSSYTNDYYTDGQLFMKSRVASYYQAGGVPLDGGYSGPTTVGDCPTDAGTVVPDNAQYHFEQNTQSWTSSGAMITGLASSTTQAYAGSRSLAVSFGGSTTGLGTVKVSAPSTPAGATVTFRLWIPAGSSISWVQPFVQQGSAGGWTFTGTSKSVSNMTTGSWYTLTVTVPATAVTPLDRLGVEFNTTAAWTGTVYLDSVSW